MPTLVALLRLILRPLIVGANKHKRDFYLIFSRNHVILFGGIFMEIAQRIFQKTVSKGKVIIGIYNPTNKGRKRCSYVRVFDIQTMKIVDFEVIDNILSDYTHSCLNIRFYDEYMDNWVIEEGWGNLSDIPVFDLNGTVICNNKAVVVAECDNGFIVCDCVQDKAFLLTEQELCDSVVNISYQNAFVKDDCLTLPLNLPFVVLRENNPFDNMREPEDIEKHKEYIENILIKAEMLNIGEKEIVISINNYLMDKVKTDICRLELCKLYYKRLNCCIEVYADTVENAERGDIDINDFDTLPYSFEVLLTSMDTDFGEYTSILTHSSYRSGYDKECRLIALWTTCNDRVYIVSLTLPNLQFAEFDDNFKTTLLKDKYTKILMPRLIDFTLPKKVYSIENPCLTMIRNFEMESIPLVLDRISKSALKGIHYSGSTMIFSDEVYSIGGDLSFIAPNLELIYFGNSIEAVPNFSRFVHAPKLKYIIIKNANVVSNDILKYSIEHDVELYVPENSCLLDRLSLQIDYNGYSPTNIRPVKNLTEVNIMLVKACGVDGTCVSFNDEASFVKLPTLEPFKAIHIPGLGTQGTLKMGIISGYSRKTVYDNYLNKLYDKLEKYVCKNNFYYLEKTSMKYAPEHDLLTHKDVGIILEDLANAYSGGSKIIGVAYVLFNKVVGRLETEQSESATRYSLYFKSFASLTPLLFTKGGIINYTVSTCRDDLSYYYSFLNKAAAYSMAVKFLLNRVSTSFNSDNVIINYVELLDLYLSLAYFLTKDYGWSLEDYEIEKYLCTDEAELDKKVTEYEKTLKENEPNIDVYTSNYKTKYSMGYNGDLNSLTNNLILGLISRYKALRAKNIEVAPIIQTSDILVPEKQELVLELLGFSLDAFKNTSNFVLNKSGTLVYLTEADYDKEKPATLFLATLARIINRDISRSFGANYNMSSTLNNILKILLVLKCLYTEAEWGMFRNLLSNGMLDSLDSIYKDLKQRGLIDSYIFGDEPRSEDLEIFLATMGKCTGNHTIDMTEEIMGIPYYEKHHGLYKPFVKISKEAYNIIAHNYKITDLPKVLGYASDVDYLLSHLYLIIIKPYQFLG